MNIDKIMKLGALFSGGKDSTYAIYLAKKQGYDISCLLTLLTKSADSHLLHHQNIIWTKLQAESMKIPQITIQLTTDQTEGELVVLNDLVKKAKNNFDIDGLVHGGIASVFQKEKFDTICQNHGLIPIAPIWQIDSKKYMDDIIESNFEFTMTSVSADGLDDSWLGKIITKNDLERLEKLSVKYGFNLTFEGGEAETFVLNCPLFTSPIKIDQGKRFWDGYRGRFEIVEAGVNYNA